MRPAFPGRNWGKLVPIPNHIPLSGAALLVASNKENYRNEVRAPPSWDNPHLLRHTKAPAWTETSQDTER